ncbi:MAG: long-chain-fatty-acid--CoA ligase [Acidimicrobiales bacterium]
MKNNIGLFITKRAQLSPGVDAVVDVASGTRLNYVELNERCNRVANGMTDAGLEQGDRVATLLMNGPEFVETFFGVAKVGGVIVALNWRLVADELSFILTDAGATTLVFGTAFNELVTELESRGTDGTQVTKWIHVGDAADRPAFADGYADMLAGASTDEPDVVACDDDLLFIMYTSGTTGLPKGVMHSHKTAIWSVITGNATADVRYGDRYLICLPLFHVGALNPMLATFHKGGSAVIMAEFDPVKIWEVFRDEKITVTLAVPAMLNFMLLTYDKEAHDISKLRWVMSGAAPVPVSLIETYAAMDIEIHQVYGLTETCGPGCLISPDDALVRAGSTGKAFFHTEVKVVDEKGEVCDADEAGEVWLRGPHMMVGYWNRPEATAESITPEGWLRTGDIAVMDGDGFVYIQDRVKDMIISGGENVYPAEIENVLMSMDGVTEAAVIGVPSEKWGESPLAIVVRSDESLTAQQVLEYCDGKLARFKLPKLVEFADVIPRNPTGKVLKRVLREQYEGVSTQ